MSLSTDCMGYSESGLTFDATVNEQNYKKIKEIEQKLQF